MTAADADGVESVRITSWKSAYRGVLDQALLDGLAVDPARVEWLRGRLADPAVTTHVAVDGGQVVGMATVGPCRDDVGPGLAELYAIYLLPDRWGAGLGRALLEACGPVDLVWVLEGNSRGRAFYERQGFLADGTVKVLERLGGARELRYARANRG